MHHARRSLRATRLGTRTAATAAKATPRAPGKWGVSLPEPASASPNLSKWSKPSPPPPHSTASPNNNYSSQRTSPSHDGYRPLPPYNSQRTPSASGDRSEFMIRRSTSPPSPPSEGVRNRANSSSISMFSNRLQRDSAPHQDISRSSPPRNSDPAHRLSSKNIPRHDKDRSSDRSSGRSSENADNERSSRLIQDQDARGHVVDILSDGAFSANESQRDTRNNRTLFKERGSLLSRLRDDVTIPKHPRGQTNRDVASTSKEKPKKKKPKAMSKPISKDIFIPSITSVGNLARLLRVKLDDLQRQMIRAGMENEASYDHMLTAEYASLLAMEFGRNPVVNDEAAFDIHPPPPHPNPSSLPLRPPVVTIMGHVDHGKTTLLDTLRSTSVAKGEAGGITQHIGAFSVPVVGTDSGSNAPRSITFLDTPGHAAFSAMRARGASVTDIIVLVVAADDGIMPQTREVIELVKKDNVGLVVAINKVDKPGVDADGVEKALLADGIQLETFGGDVPVVHVSGLTGQGLDQLVETISAMAEMQDLHAEREGHVHGYVLESKVHKGLGPVATVLLLRGCLKPGSLIICGRCSAKVRLLTDSQGKSVKAAYPGDAVIVSGWKELPHAGDEVLQGSESDVKKALANRLRWAEDVMMMNDLEAINEQRREEREKREIEEDPSAETPAHEKEGDGKKELRLIVKGDVSGSVEAVVGALQGIGSNLAGVKIVTIGVGDVTESDVMRAKAVDGIVVAFSVNIPRSVQAEAATQHVPLLSSSIIYQLMDNVKERVIALLPVIIEKRVTGEANVLQLFDIHLKSKKIMKVAGCRVVNGVVEKSKMARLVRNGETIHEGKLGTLRHLKKDIMEAAKGLECGIAFEKFDDIQEGDLIQVYQQIEKPGTL